MSEDAREGSAERDGSQGQEDAGCADPGDVTRRHRGREGEGPGREAEVGDRLGPGPGELGVTAGGAMPRRWWQRASFSCRWRLPRNP